MADSYADAISGIESGGRYSLLGPITKSGDRAYGRYQVMGANIPEWTKQHFGQSLTPQEFLNNPQAQDAVFNGQFGQYVNKYGPEGAARAWFAGEGGMNNPDAKDILGTSVTDYSRKFTNALGGAAPPLPQPAEVGAQTNQPQAAQTQTQQPAGLFAGISQPDANKGLLSLVASNMTAENQQPLAPPSMGLPVHPQPNIQRLLAFLQARSRPASWSL